MSATCQPHVHSMATTYDNPVPAAPNTVVPPYANASYPANVLSQAQRHQSALTEAVRQAQHNPLAVPIPQLLPPTTHQLPQPQQYSNYHALPPHPPSSFSDHHEGVPAYEPTANQPPYTTYDHHYPPMPHATQHAPHSTISVVSSNSAILAIRSGSNTTSYAPVPASQTPLPSSLSSNSVPQVSLPPILLTQEVPAQPTAQPPGTHATIGSSIASSHTSAISTTNRLKTYHEEGAGATHNGLENHSQQIPACISSCGGSLSDFAAQMTCFIWFENIDILHKAKNFHMHPSTTVHGLIKYSTPHSNFKKWVYNILSTTQVTQSVIFLALLFIYRLKTINPNVKGGVGSEYRLLTVALMLGNKFLDDNTYTNKTWADVSSIAVQDIHFMEVEFLSNMRYSLLVTKEQWEEWLKHLSSFLSYYEIAIRSSISPSHIISPKRRGPSPNLSPSHQRYYMPPVTPTTTSTYATAPATAHYMAPPVNTWQAPSHYSSPLSHKISLPTRKRTISDEIYAEPPSKRVTIQPQQPPISVVPPTSSATTNLSPSPALPSTMSATTRLPPPNLTVNTTNHTISTPPQYTPVASLFPSNFSLPPLPPPASHAMASRGHVATPITDSSVSLPSTSFSNTNHSFATPTRTHPPHMYGSSPLRESFTPVSDSPVVYYRRDSPWKPIRDVNMLLGPHSYSSASFNDYHLSTNPNIQYQPLGRRNDVRPGVVPEFRNYR